MDPFRFDRLTRSFTDAYSRRAALGGMFADALVLLGMRYQEAKAHDPLTACKKKSGDAKKKCVKKAKKHNAQHVAEVTVTPPPPPSPPPPQCLGVGATCDLNAIEDQCCGDNLCARQSATGTTGTCQPPNA